jgi:hypothetical protein
VTATKRPLGRPSFTGVAGARYQITIPSAIADKLRKLGDGSLSRGVIKAAAKVKP